MKTRLLGIVLALTVMGSQAQPVDGEVTKIDKAQARLTLRHDGIKSLDMPPMTMVFRVTDAKMLDSVVVGEKVKFDAEKIGGYYTVTRIAKPS